MSDNEWLTVSEASERINVPVETIRRYLRSHNVHMKVKKIHKKYFIHDDSITVIKKIRALYEQGKNVEEVEESLSASGIPMTITVHDEKDEPVTVNVIDELKIIKEELKEQKNFNLTLLEEMKKQHLFYEKKFEELKYDRDLVNSLRQSMQQKRIDTEEQKESTEKLGNMEKQLTELIQKQSDNKELFNQMSEMNRQIEQMKAMIKESAAGKEKKSFFRRLFNKE